MRGIQDTSNRTYRQLMGNGLRYEIPKFQRDYSWENEQWDDLWNDIHSLRSSREGQHYMGYLVLQSIDNKNFTIIDGQQRLTTLSILILTVLKCLDDLVASDKDAENNARRKVALQNSYIGYIDPVTLISNNKLKLNRNNDEYYRMNMVLLRPLPLRNTNASEKSMRECFNWFYERVKKVFSSGEDLAELIEGVADSLFFTTITVTDQVNAFKIFETLNARGVKLSSADLLKNYIFSVVDESKPHISEIEELESIWSSIVARLGGQNFEDYLRYYWNSYNKTVRKIDLFSAIRNSITSKEAAFTLVRNLREDVDLYIAIQNPEDEFWKELPQVKEGLAQLKIFNIRQTNSLLISAYKYLPETAFKKLLEVCVVISFRYNIVGGRNPNDQETVYNTLALKIYTDKKFSIQDVNEIYINDDSFEKDFSDKSFKDSTRNHKIVKYIFSKIELLIYKNEISYESDLYSVEHILPESADESWGEFNDEAVKRSVYRLGNLTLLEKKLNRNADVQPYSKKKDIYKQSNCNLTRAVPEHYDTWNEQKISARQKELGKAAKTIWRVQELE